MPFAWPHLTLAVLLAAAMSGAPPADAAQQSFEEFPPGCKNMSVRPRDKLRRLSFKGRVRFMSGSAARARSETPVISPRTQRARAPRAMAKPGRRFYVICEQSKFFRAVSSGYGNGRKLKRANFSNGRQCARNFSNAEGSKLTAGGAYVTAETRTSFKGYHRQSGKRKAFHRTFLLFDGEGDTANARERAIGGHPAVFLKWQCRFKNPKSPHADKDGYVPYGKLVNYTGGRSNGCTTWSPAESREILSLVEGNPTTLYIYPEGRDINAVANAVRKRKSLANAGLYWNASCLKSIGAPKFWPKRKLQPIINEWRRSLPKQPPLELPICK